MSRCTILERLTNFSVDTTYQCRSCGTSSTIVDNMNVRYENIHGNSIYEILTNEENVSPILKRCDHCQKDTSHAEVESFYELPDVLVISLQRWRQDGETITKDCREVEPSVLLQFDDAAYSLNAVVTHFGSHVYEGHYITSLYRNNRWIHCNDEKISRPCNDVPKMGYLYFYDQIPLPIQSVSTNRHEQQDASARKSSSKNSASHSQKDSTLNQSQSSSKRENSESSEEDDISSKGDDLHQRKRIRSEGPEVESDYDSNSEDGSYLEGEDESESESELDFKSNGKSEVQSNSVMKNDREKPSLFKRIKKFFKRPKCKSSEKVAMKRQEPMLKCQCQKCQNNITGPTNAKYKLNSVTEDDSETEESDQSEDELESVAVQPYNDSVTEGSDQSEIESEDEVESVAVQDAESDFKSLLKSKSESATETGRGIMKESGAESDQDGKRRNEQSNEHIVTNKFKCKGCGTEMTKTKLKNHLLKIDSCREEYGEEEIEELKQPTKRVRKDYQKQYYKKNKNKTR